MKRPEDPEALRDRVASLERDIEQAQAKRQRLEALDGEARRLEGALEEARGRLGKAARKLPLLDRIEVASPCSASWDEMVGDERSRFCGHCDKHVYDLSAMSRQEAEKLIAEKEGELCVRLTRRKDGRVVTNDCPVGLRRLRRKRLVVALAGGGALAALGVSAFLAPGPAPVASPPDPPPPCEFTGKVPAAEPAPERPVHVMGATRRMGKMQLDRRPGAERQGDRDPR